MVRRKTHLAFGVFSFPMACLLSRHGLLAFSQWPACVPTSGRLWKFGSRRIRRRAPVRFASRGAQEPSARAQADRAFRIDGFRAVCLEGWTPQHGLKVFPFDCPLKPTKRGCPEKMEPHLYVVLETNIWTIDVVSSESQLVFTPGSFRENLSAVSQGPGIFVFLLCWQGRVGNQWSCHANTHCLLSEADSQFEKSKDSVEESPLFSQVRCFFDLSNLVYIYIHSHFP